MSALSRGLAIVGAVVVVGGASAAAYVYVYHPAWSPLPASQTTASAPAVAAAPATPEPAPAAPAPAAPATEAPATPAAAAPAAPEDTANLSAQDVASVEFSSLVQPFSLTRDSAAYVAASNDAPQMYPLRAGTGLKSAEKSKDGKWVIALTEDGQAAYLPTPDLGPYDPGHTPQPELPATLSGAADVVDTATLKIDGQNVPLAGVVGETGDPATSMQSLIQSQGPQVNCALQGQAYKCSLPNGIDIARAALYNGGAKPSDDASDDYRAQADSARTARRGVWK